MTSLDQYYGQKISDPKVIQPTQLTLGKSTEFRWDNEGRLRDDQCTVQVEEKESRKPGDYQLSGYDPTYQNVSDYTNTAEHSRTHFQKVYRNPYTYVDDESNLFQSESTNPRYINQLFARPYAGFFCGPGMRSIGHKDLESALQQSLLTNLRQKPCESCRGKSMYRFQCLPDYGNPQRIEVIEPPPPHLGGWQRGGLPSRDLVRRIDYQKRCANQLNNKTIYKS
jgi:hypothetical protein